MCSPALHSAPSSCCSAGSAKGVECARAPQWSRAVFHPSTSLCSVLANTCSCRMHASISGFSQWVRLLGLTLCSAQLKVAVRLKESKMGVLSEQFNPHLHFSMCVLTTLLMLKHIYQSKSTTSEHFWLSSMQLMKLNLHKTWVMEYSVTYPPPGWALLNLLTCVISCA